MDVSHWPIWLQLAREFQVAIGAFVAFAGVLWTIRAGAATEHARKAKENEHERALLAVALKAELENIADLLRARATTLDESFTSLPVPISVPHFTAIYTTNIPNLGLLELAQARRIVRAYTMFFAFGEMQSLIEQRIDPLRKKTTALNPFGPDVSRDIEFGRESLLSYIKHLQPEIESAVALLGVPTKNKRIADFFAFNALRQQNHPSSSRSRNAA